MATLKEIEERLQLERDLRDTTARLHAGEAMSHDERQLLMQRQQAIVARKLELDGPPAEPGPTLADAEAAAARSAQWREADAAYRAKRRELEREIGRLDATLAPSRRETLERELQALRPPDPAAPPSE